MIRMSDNVEVNINREPSIGRPYVKATIENGDMNTRIKLENRGWVRCQSRLISGTSNYFKYYSKKEKST